MDKASILGILIFVILFFVYYSVAKLTGQFTKLMLIIGEFTA